MRQLVLLLLAAITGCTDDTETLKLSHPEGIPGVYVSHTPKADTELHLSENGQGAMLSLNKDGSFSQIMTFDWGTSGSTFYMSEIYFSTDMQRILKTDDDSTGYKQVGSDLHSQSPTGSWIEWERRGDTPYPELINALLVEPG